MSTQLSGSGIKQAKEFIINDIRDVKIKFRIDVSVKDEVGRLSIIRLSS